MNRLFRLFFLTLFAVACSQWALANGPTTIYVDAGNTSGPWDGTTLHPYKAIQDGINAANSGNIVDIKTGAYVEDISVSSKTLTLNGSSGLSTVTSIYLGSGAQVSLTANHLSTSYVDVNGGSLQDALNLIASGGYIGVAGGPYAENLSVSTANVTMLGSGQPSITGTVSGSIITVNSGANNFALHYFLLPNNKSVSITSATGTDLSYNYWNTCTYSTIASNAGSATILPYYLNSAQSIVSAGQASGIQFTNVTDTQLGVQWNNGNGDGCVIAMQVYTNGTSSAAPIDGTSYGAGTTVGDITYIDAGTNNYATFTGLTPGRQYTFRVFEYRNGGCTSKIFNTIDQPSRNVRSNYTKPACTFSVSSNGATFNLTGPFEICNGANLFAKFVVTSDYISSNPIAWYTYNGTQSSTNSFTNNSGTVTLNTTSAFTNLPLTANSVVDGRGSLCVLYPNAAPSVNVTVYPNFTPGAVGGVASQSICYNTMPAPDELTANPAGGDANYTYTWYNDKTVGSIGSTSIYDIPALTTTTKYWYTVHDGHNCQGTLNSSNTITITVYPNFTPGAVGGVSNQSICYNTTPAPTMLTSSPNGGDGSYTYAWYNDQAGLIGTSSTYGIPALSTTTKYWYTVHDGHNCQGGTLNSSNTITITVYPNFTPGAVGGVSNQSICYNTAPTPTMLTSSPNGGDGIYTYAWYNDQAGLIGTSSTFGIPTLTTTTKYWYTVRDGHYCQGSPSTSSNTITITVFPNFTPGAVGGVSNQSICYSTAPTPTMLTSSPAGGDGEYTYAWYNDQTGLIGTSSTFGIPTLMTTTKYWYTVHDGHNCQGGILTSSNTITITVYPNFTPGAVGGVSNQSICYGAAPTPTMLTSSPNGGDGIYTYAWYNDQTGLIGTSSTYGIPSLMTTTKYWYTVRDGHFCQGSPTTSSNTITITVFPNFTPGAVGGVSNQSICYNTAPTPTMLTSSPNGGDGTYTYAWYNDKTGLIGTSSTFGIPTLTTTTKYWYTVRDGHSCQGSPLTSSNTITITVYPEFLPGTVGGVASQSICYNTAPTPTMLTSSPMGGDGTYTYAWYNDQAGFLGSSSTYGIPSLTTTTKYWYTVHDGHNCQGGILTSSNTITITVFPNFTPGAVGGVSNQTICYNSAPSPTLLTSSPNGGDGTYTYAWYSDQSVSSIGSGSTYNIPTLMTTTKYWYTVRDGHSCQGSPLNSSNTITITVYPEFVAGSVSGVATQSICYNTAPSPSLMTANPAGGNNSYTIAWYNDKSTLSIGSGSTYNIGSALTSTTKYWYTAHDGNNCQGTLNSNTITITVYPNFTPGAVTGVSSQSICYSTAPSPALLSANPLGGDGTYTYRWYNDQSGSSICSTQTYTIPTLTTTTKYWYTVRDGLSCQGSPLNSSNTITITVYPQFVANSLVEANATFPTYQCYGNNSNTFTASATGGNGTRTYTWHAVVGEPLSNNTNAVYIADNLTNSNTFWCVINDDCNSPVTTNTARINVYPVLSAGAINTSSATASICWGNNPGTISVSPTGGNGSYTYLWYKDNATTGVTTSFLAMGSLTASASYYCVVTDGTSCGSKTTTSNYNVTVYPLPIMGSITQTPSSVCDGYVATLTTTSPTFSNPVTGTWHWQSNNGGGWVDVSNTTDALSMTFTATNGVDYRAIGTAIGGADCWSNTSVFTPTIIYQPTTQASPINFTADGGTTVDFDVTSGNGAKTLILIQETSSASAPTAFTATNNTLYTVGTTYSSWKVVANTIHTNGQVLTNTGVSVSSSTPNVWIQAIDYNTSVDGTTAVFYKTGTATRNPNNVKKLVFPTAIPNQIDGVNFSNFTIQSKDRAGFGITQGSGGSALTVTLSKATSTVGTLIGATQSISSASFVTVSSFTWSNSDNGADDVPPSLRASATDYLSGISSTFGLLPSEPLSQATTLLLSSTNCSTMVVKRSVIGSGRGSVVVARPNQGPGLLTDGYWYYDANSGVTGVYGVVANRLADGVSFVCGNILTSTPFSSSITISGFSGNTTYWVRLYNYNGSKLANMPTGPSGYSGHPVNYNINSALWNPKSKLMPACKLNDGYGLEFAGLDLSSNRKQVVSNWQTKMEAGVVGFILYRAEFSKNNEPIYRKIASYDNNSSLIAKNNIQGNSYGYIDNDPSLVAGNSYIYKLAYVAYDGTTYDLSEEMVTILTAEFINQATLWISDVTPLPASTFIKFNMQIANEQPVTIDVLDLSGNKVVDYCNGKVYPSHSYDINIPLDALQSGTYILRVIGVTETAINKFVIVK